MCYHIIHTSVVCLMFCRVLVNKIRYSTIVLNGAAHVALVFKQPLVRQLVQNSWLVFCYLCKHGRHYVRLASQVFGPSNALASTHVHTLLSKRHPLYPVPMPWFANPLPLVQQQGKPIGSGLLMQLSLDTVVSSWMTIDESWLSKGCKLSQQELPNDLESKLTSRKRIRYQ